MRRLTEQIRILKTLGCEVVSLRENGKHLVFECRGPDGGVFKTASSKTPSDHRALKNWRSDVRRKLQGGKR